MRNLLALILLFCVTACSNPAFARHVKHRHIHAAPETYHRFVHRHRATYIATHSRHRTGTRSSARRWASRNASTFSGLVTIQTAAGKITVAPHMAAKFQGFFQDLVDKVYRPRYVGCYARGGHMPNSMHYTGEACDVDQKARNRTAGPMYHVSEIARKWGLTDGCSFRDCGHISNGR